MGSKRSSHTNYDTLLGFFLACGAVGIASSGVAGGVLTRTVQVVAAVGILIGLTLLASGLTSAVPKELTTVRIGVCGLVLALIILAAMSFVRLPNPWVLWVTSALQLIICGLALYVSFSIGRDARPSNPRRWAPLAITAVGTAMAAAELLMQTTFASGTIRSVDISRLTGLVEVMCIAALGVVFATWSLSVSSFNDAEY